MFATRKDHTQVSVISGETEEELQDQVNHFFETLDDLTYLKDPENKIQFGWKLINITPIPNVNNFKKTVMLTIEANFSINGAENIIKSIENYAANHVGGEN